MRPLRSARGLARGMGPRARPRLRSLDLPLPRRARWALRRQTQRLLFLFAALLAFATLPPLAVTAWVLAAYAGYCEDVGFCSPEWWRPLGLALLLPLGIVVYVLAASVKGLRSTRP
jgi:hypothetical protein